MWTIFGVGDLVWDIIDTIELAGFQIKQIVLNQPTSIIDFYQYKVITLNQYLESNESEYRIFGFIDPRKQKFLDQINKTCKDFANAVHIRSWVCHTSRNRIGNGNYLAANSTIASKVLIGDFNYLNRNASIGHHTVVGSYNHIGPGATVCGKCTIGNSNFLGAGCVIKDGITIKENIIIGAGSLVTSDLLDKGVYIGSPAKKIDVIPKGSVASFYQVR